MGARILPEYNLACQQRMCFGGSFDLGRNLAHFELPPWLIGRKSSAAFGKHSLVCSCTT
jgi:hypothetical protein